MVCLRHGYINIYGNRFINVTTSHLNSAFCIKKTSPYYGVVFFVKYLYIIYIIFIKYIIEKCG